jgi:hypothetical protein
MAIASKPAARRAGAATVVAVALLGRAVPAAAQIVGHGTLGLLALPGLPGLNVPIEKVTSLSSGLLGQAQALAQSRLDAAAAAVRAHPDQLELDERGDVVVRGAVLAVWPSAAALDRAAAAGFDLESREPIEGLDLVVVTLRAPRAMTARTALRRLRALDPRGQYDYDPLYATSGAILESAPGAASTDEAQPGGARLGLVDTGVDTGHPAFVGAHVLQQGFAPGGLRIGAHGTAVASLMIGQAPGFEGVAPGARLAAADIFGDGPTGGASDMLVRALGWTAAQGARVVNVSLVGPPNAALAASVKTLQARGVIIVAPVGNDGPAAPPAYPASYPGVIAVTPVDPDGRVLFEAGRSAHVDFAARGAELKAARPGGGWASVRGSSFAAPIVAARLALAETAGAPGPDAIAQVAHATRRGSGYGHGLVEFSPTLTP